jgi:predicted DNA-binding transcriptional regulator AlpA
MVKSRAGDIVGTTPDRLLTWPQVAAIVPFGRQHVHRLEAAGKFPQRVQVGAGRVLWKLSEIQAWLDSLPRGPLAQTPNAKKRRGRAA